MGLFIAANKIIAKTVADSTLREASYVEDPQNKVISDETKALIDKLLLEKIPLAGIARVVDVSEPWLQGYVNEKYASVPRPVKVRAKKRGA